MPSLPSAPPNPASSLPSPAVILFVFFLVFAVITLIYVLYGWVSQKSAARRVRLSDLENQGSKSAVLINNKAKTRAQLKDATSTLAAARAQIFTLQAKFATKTQAVSLHKDLMANKATPVAELEPLKIMANIPATLPFVKRDTRKASVRPFNSSQERRLPGPSPLREVYTAPSASPVDEYVTSHVVSQQHLASPASQNLPPSQVVPIPSTVQFVKREARKLSVGPMIPRQEHGPPTLSPLRSVFMASAAPLVVESITSPSVIVGPQHTGSPPVLEMPPLSQETLAPAPNSFTSARTRLLANIAADDDTDSGSEYSYSFDQDEESFSADLPPTIAQHPALREPLLVDSRLKNSWRAAHPRQAFIKRTVKVQQEYKENTPIA